MGVLENKIDFTLLVTVNNANPNGDPLNGNRPRTTYDGYGEISDVCIKRKIRNRLQDEGEHVFVQPSNKCDDGCQSLKERAERLYNDLMREHVVKAPTEKTNEEKKSREIRNVYEKKACETWIDVRAFGQVFAIGKKKMIKTLEKLKNRFPFEDQSRFIQG